MSFALTPSFNSTLSKLIVVDIAPSVGSISEDFKDYTRAMSDMERNPDITSRKTAETFLKERVSVSLP
jgi:hypothetical protein